MLKYLLRRVFLTLPTLLVVSLFAFWLGKCAPGDPVVNVFGDENFQTLDPAQQAVRYQQNATQLGIHLPTFYLELTTAAYPDTLWKIFPLNRRERLRKLIGQTGNWPAVKDYDEKVSKLIRTVESLPASFPLTPVLGNELPDLIRAEQLNQVDGSLNRLKALAVQTPASTTLSNAISELDACVQTLHGQKTLVKLNTPALHWYGFNNQYHQWLKGFVTGDLGLTRKKVAVWTDLQASFYTTLAINGIAILLAYLIAVPLGVEMARKKGRRLDRWGKRGLVFMYSMPVFWLGGLLIMLVMNTEFGRSAIPSPYFDIQDAWLPGKTSFIDWWSANASKCLLPILILTLHAVAVLAIQMRSGVLDTLKADYIRTARAKGVGEEEVYWSHAFRNALFPIITIFASVLPALFTGSLVVEALFNFPGMGSKTLEAYSGNDLPLLSAIMMVAALLTVLGGLLADIFYMWADPRVRFAKENG